MESVKTVLIGGFTLAIGGVLYAVLVTFFLPMLGVTVSPVSKDWVSVLAFVGGMIAFFLTMVLKHQAKQEKRMEDMQEKQDKRMEDIVLMLKELQSPTKKDAEQDQEIKETKKLYHTLDKDVRDKHSRHETRFEILEMRVKAQEDIVKAIPQTIRSEFDTIAKILKKFVEK